MKVAMPVWQGRISPVMDAASRLLIMEYENACEISRTEQPIGDMLTPQVARQLADLGVNVLICGGISRLLFSLIAAQGISIIPWVMGDIDEILRAYNAKSLESREFMMPGCGGCRRGWRHNHGSHDKQGQGMSRGKRMGRKEFNRKMERNE